MAGSFGSRSFDEGKMSNISIDIHHYIHYEGIEVKLSEAIAEEKVALAAIVAQLTKAKDEIVAKINELAGKAVDPDVDPTEIAADLTALSGLAQAFDDITPDPVPPVEAPPVVEPVPVVDPAPVVDTTPVDVPVVEPVPADPVAEVVPTDPAPPA